MNTKNVIKRIGIVFIFVPIFIIFVLLNLIFWITAILWYPFYYIITGNDIGYAFEPENTPLDFFFRNFGNWYIDKFGPDELK